MFTVLNVFRAIIIFHMLNSYYRCLVLIRHPYAVHECPHAVHECRHAVHECPHAGYDSPTTFPIPHTTEIDPWIDRTTVTTNTTKFYSKTLSYWLPDRCRSFPDRADFQDVSTMLPRLHEPTMPMPTIFQIVEIGTARSAQCDLGLTWIHLNRCMDEWSHAQ